MTPARAVTVALLASAVLVGTRPGAEAQFPRGLLAAAPREKPDKGFCTIETRPLSFGIYDPEANADVHAVAQVIYTCDNQAKKIRIEMTTGAANQFSPRHMSATATDHLDYNIYLDSTHQTIWGQGLYGTDVYYQNNPPNGTPVVVPAYGRIPARQQPAPGNYADVLTVRVLF
jgi:spore coat protein U-like protein